MPWPLWLLSGVVLLAADVHYTRDFTLFSFGLSAIMTSLTAGLGILASPAQWVCFGILSIALLFWARDWLRDSLFASPAPAELENVVGQIALPVDDLPAFGFGKAQLRGATWSAHNASHVAIARGQRCKVMKIKGLTLWIQPE